MRSLIMLETMLRIVPHTDVVEINVTSECRANHFVTLIDEASWHVSACQLKTKDEAAELVRQYVRWVERHTDGRVKKIVLGGGKEYLR